MTIVFSDFAINQIFYRPRNPIMVLNFYKVKEKNRQLPVFKLVCCCWRRLVFFIALIWRTIFF
jgi:hypothetical protein